MEKPKKRRKFKGYAVLNWHGDLLWGTLSTSAEEAQKKHDNFNPDPTGDGMGESIVSIDIFINT